MSLPRPTQVGSTQAVPGAVALPLPAGEPDALRAVAARLRGLEGRARETAAVRGELERLLPQVWTGAAADAAVTEARELARRSGPVLDGVATTRVALDQYAGQLEGARSAVSALQRQWDSCELDHARAVAAVQLQAALDVDAGRALARLDDEHRLTRSRLTRQHAGVGAALSAAAARAARTIEASTDATFPALADAGGTAVRHRVIDGLPISEGAVRAAETRRLATTDATRLRLVLQQAGAAPPDEAAVAALVAALSAGLTDPVYAQAVVDELGVDGIAAAVVATQTGTTTRARPLVSVLGALLFTAATPPAPGSLDPRTERQVLSSAGLLHDELVDSMGRQYTSPDGRHRFAGYWVVGQLLVGARQSGWAATVPAPLLRRLVSAASAAEIAESHDGDAEPQHGTTLRSDDAAFASLFDDADRSGDPLHVLLGEAGSDPVEHAALLATPIDGGRLTGARGEQLLLAEYLTRRWNTYLGAAADTPQGLTLATNDDLRRLLATGATGNGQPAAEVRAHVMSEVARLSAFAQQGISSARLYEQNTGQLESTLVSWVSGLGPSIDATLRAASEGRVVDGWSVASGDGYAPNLQAAELVALVGAFAVDDTFALGALAPAENYRRLERLELTRLRQDAWNDAPIDATISRLAFFDVAASTALLTKAIGQDAVNQQLWQGLAEAKNVALGLRTLSGTKDVVMGFVTSGTTRSPLDDLVISVVRSNVAQSQALADEARSAALHDALARLSAPRLGEPTVRALIAAGVAAAPALPSSRQLGDARRREILEAAKKYLDDRLEKRRSDVGTRRGVPLPRGGGTKVKVDAVDRP